MYILQVRNIAARGGEISPLWKVRRDKPVVVPFFLVKVKQVYIVQLNKGWKSMLWNQNEPFLFVSFDPLPSVSGPIVNLSASTSFGPLLKLTKSYTNDCQVNS